MVGIYEEILEYVNKLYIIDTHEHLPCCENDRNKDTDVLEEYLKGNFNCDLISAGMNKDDLNKVVNSKISIIEKWMLVEPYWEIVRNTGYGRVLDITAKGLYGVEKINRDTIEELNYLFKDSIKSGHFHKVLKKMSRIEVSVLDNKLDCDQTFFRSVYRLDRFIFPRTGSDIEIIEKNCGIRICSLDNWLEACEMMLDNALKSGALGLKCGLAYLRTLKFERVKKSEAEEGFLKMIETMHYPKWIERVFTVGKAFQDYMMHYVLKLANKRNLVFQFHTGLHEGNGNFIYNSDPALLSNLYLEYPDIDFDIFHIGYPYQQTLSVLAKTYPNVYIDMCWAHTISPTACVNTLIEWFDSVPPNKISAFGGDYGFVDAVYGSLQMAKANICKALAVKVHDGCFDIETAKYLSEMLFYKNPLKILRLENSL